MLRDVFGIVGSTLVGTFHVEDVVAEGGYGVVYRAEHIAFRAPVALKCLKVHRSSPEQRDDFVERFRAEAEILFHLSAQIQEVVRPLHADAIVLEGGELMPFLAMEWVEGTPLDSIVILREQHGEPPLSVRETTKMLTPIAHALSRAHALQPPEGELTCVTHCDLKPENILITAPGSPVRARDPRLRHRAGARGRASSGRQDDILRGGAVHARLRRSRAMGAQTLRSDGPVDGCVGPGAHHGGMRHRPAAHRG